MFNNVTDFYRQRLTKLRVENLHDVWVSFVEFYLIISKKVNVKSQIGVLLCFYKFEVVISFITSNSVRNVSSWNKSEKKCKRSSSNFF